MEFGGRLKQLMKKKNLTGKKLSRDLDISYNSIQEWLSSRMPRDPQVLKKLSNYFGVSVYFLLYGEEDPASLISNILDKTEIHTGLYEISIKRVKTK